MKQENINICKSVLDEINNAEDLYEYLQDKVLEVNYIVNEKKEYVGSVLTMMLGGPTVKIDTYEQKVKLFWWSEYAEYHIYSEEADRIDDVIREWYYM